MPTKRSLMEARGRLGLAFDVPPWLRHADTVDRASPEWQSIEAAADWSQASADDLFSLAEQRDQIRSTSPAEAPAQRSLWQRVRGYFGRKA